MTSDMKKTKDELIKELRKFRKRAEEADLLDKRFEEKTAAYNKECDEQSRAQEALRMARVIIDQSPVILFRRLAGDDPKLVYVSDNIVRFGYTAEEFLTGKINFGDIVHPDDYERWGAEITE